MAVDIPVSWILPVIGYGILAFGYCVISALAVVGLVGIHAAFFEKGHDLANRAGLLVVSLLLTAGGAAPTVALLCHLGWINLV